MKKRHKNPGPPPAPPKEVSIGLRKEVLGLFRECFLALHPKEGWPEWLDDCAETHCHVAEAGQSTFSLVAYPDPAAHDPKNYCWQELDGHRMLCSIDEKTGAARVILCMSFKPSEIVTLFKAVLDMKTAVVSLLVDSDFSKMDGKLWRGASGQLTRDLWWYERR